MVKANPALAWILLLGLGLTWGSSFILMKYCLKVFSPIEVASLRIFISSIVLLPVVFLNFKKIPWNRWWMFLLAGMLGNGIPSFMFPIAQTRLDSSLVGMLNSIMPLLTIIVGAFFFKAAISGRKVVGIALGITGVYCLLFPKMNNSTDLSFASFVFVASMCYAINTNFVKNYLSDIDSITLTAIAFLFIGPASGFTLYSSEFRLHLAHPNALKALGLLCILAILGTAIAVIVFNYLVKIRSAIFAASVTYIVPVFAILWGVFFKETIQPIQFLGMGIVLAGVYVVNK